MKYIAEFLRTILPQGLAKLHFNAAWALLSLVIGLTHTGVVMALLSFKLISETVALAVLDHSLSLTVVLCIIGALFPSKKPPAKKDNPPTEKS